METGHPLIVHLARSGQLGTPGSLLLLLMDKAVKDLAKYSPPTRHSQVMAMYGFTIQKQDLPSVYLRALDELVTNLRPSCVSTITGRPHGALNATYVLQHALDEISRLRAEKDDYGIDGHDLIQLEEVISKYEGVIASSPEI